MESTATRRQGGYRAWFAPGTRQKTGMALLVSNRLGSMPVEIVYQDPTGHTLIAKMNPLGRLPMIVVISHADPESDDKRAIYFENLLNHIPPVDPKQPDRQGVWMGDFNFEEPREPGTDTNKRTRDGAPPAREGTARARMLKAYATVCRKLGCESAGGLEDAYVVTHPGKAHGTSRTGRAIDRVLVDPRMIGSVPGLVDAAHVHQNLLQVVGQSGTLRAAPDHKAVKAVLRLSDIKRPPHRPRYTLSGLSAARRAEIESCVDTILKDEQRDPEETEANYTATVSAMIDGYRTADRKANIRETHTLISKLDNLQREMRQIHKFSPLLTAYKAQAERVRAQLHRAMQRRAEAHTNTRQQQR